MSSAMELLGRAFQADPDNAGVLLALAHYKLLKGDYDAVLNLACAAVSVLEGGSARQRAQAALLQARAYHAKGQQAEAKRLYGLVSGRGPRVGRSAGSSVSVEKGRRKGHRLRELQGCTCVVVHEGLTSGLHI
jgi:hypothetical protein